MIGQRGSASRAVRADPEVLDQQALVEDDLERPPDGLDVGSVHRPVGAGRVDPVAHPLGHRLERVDVPQHRLAAPLVELPDAVGLDALLAGQAEFFLDRYLHRQSVAVPACPARHVEPLHGLEARERVLEHPCLDVVHAGHAVRGRRALIEGPERAGRALVEGALEHVPVPPPGQYLVLDGRQVDDRGQIREMPASKAGRRGTGGRGTGGRGTGGAGAWLLRAVCARHGRRPPADRRASGVSGPQARRFAEGRGTPAAAPRYHPPWPRSRGRQPGSCDPLG